MHGTEESFSRSPFLQEILRVLFYVNVTQYPQNNSLFYVRDLLYLIRILFVDYFSVNFCRLLYGFFLFHHWGCFLTLLLNV